MNIFSRFNQHTHLKNSALNALVLSTLFGLAFLTYRYNAEFDVSANGSNTLSAGTQKVLASLPDAVVVTVYLKTSHPLKRQIKPLLERYRHQKANLKIQFIDPEINLEKARELNVGSQGLIVVEYQGRSEKINFLDESTLTNALLQLANAQQHWVSFLTGHGERSATGLANFDLGSFSKDLALRSIKTQALNLAEIGAIPDNSTVLVLASPRVALLPGELTLIQNYIQQGGNLLLLTDPEDKYLTTIEQSLGIHKTNSAILDASSKLYGIDDPSFLLISRYDRHPITNGMQEMTVFPAAAALTIAKNTDFSATAILKKDVIAVGYALTREIKGKNEQRIVVIGDGDFLSNTFLGNVGNDELGVRIFDWLTHDDQFIDIPIKSAVGKSLQLSPMSIGIIGLMFLLGLPLLLVGSGFWVWRQRKRQ